MNPASVRIGTTKRWKLSDLVKTNDAGKMLVSVVKMDHPHRHQRLTIVTVPRYASEAYFKEWVYQPYAKEHRLFVSNDIFLPTAVYLPRLMLRRGGATYRGYNYFNPWHMPDSVDMNIARRDFFKREQPIKAGVFRMSMVLNVIRDKRHKWLRRRLRNIVGVQYITHPRHEEQSLVILLPPAYVPTGLNIFQELGFNVSDKLEVECGEVQPIKRLEYWSDVGQFAALSYLWMLLCIVLVNEARRGAAAFEEYKRDLIRQAGRDPAEFGM